ncbi:MAG: hypothetical protein EXS64_01575 [Candidatus Latescibacteria bacterium]|nr:hypothetical protein [Candidatus Latescibacterota bacterium]
MTFIERGKVQDGSIVFSKPLALPEGTEVVVYIESVEVNGQDAPASGGENFADIPFFGMWAGREDMRDSAAWVQKEREKWHHRTAG